MQLNNLVESLVANVFLRLLEEAILLLDDPWSDLTLPLPVALKTRLKRNIKQKKICTDSVLSAKVQQGLSCPRSYRS